MASVDQLHEDLQEILKAIRGSNPGGGKEGQEPKTLGQAFGQMARQFQGKSSSDLSKLFGKSSGGGGLGASVAGPIAGVMAPLIAAGVELAKLPEKVRAFANELHSANRQFAQFSPAMAQVFAQADFADIMRSMRKGEELAGSAGNLAAGRDRLENAVAPVTTAWDKLKNNVGAAAANAVAGFLEKSEWGQQLANGIGDVAEVAEKMNEALEASNNFATAAGNDPWVKELDKLIDEQKKAVEERRQQVVPPVPPAWDRPRGGGGDF